MRSTGFAVSCLMSFGLLGGLFTGCGAGHTGPLYNSPQDDLTMSGFADLSSTPYDFSGGSTPDLTGGDDGGATPDMAGANNMQGCGGVMGCYTVYAHSDHVLYHVDLANKMLVLIGPFKAPIIKMAEDVITDLAVAPDNTIYGISKTNLYTADPKDGHVTLVGSVAACGTQAVALTFTPNGNLYAADYQGAFCKIDPMTKQVTQIGMLGGGLAVAGDIVAIKDGTIFGTAYKISDGSNGATGLNNILVQIDPMTGQATQMIGSTGFPKMFGVAYSMSQVFGFTHDGSGNVATIDPTTGKGTLFGSFKDPMTGKGISFAGAGVNPMVPRIGPSH